MVMFKTIPLLKVVENLIALVIV